MGKLSSYLATALLTALTCLGAADTPGAVPVAERFPDFSWDRVPLYMHIRKSTGFTPEELRYLAGFPLIAFETLRSTPLRGIPLSLRCQLPGSSANPFAPQRRNQNRRETRSNGL